ncbi:OmpH family outer membrane protein [Pontibacter silvestris]|uniref:OmpH family outer membrane protein n=1 Tax=Pontibacter silvestris TaxID=2305183 RepID=A0ABW4X1N9_9BACT|nr:OmpH family outer membrane protein [Pontibacter silvestris]MCC9138248.1 OmpH family outer membrane protein [Pontibacter silvestris]
MKVSKIALGVALAALVTSCNQNQGSTQANGSSEGSTAGIGGDIVYVNSDSLLTNYEYFKDVRTRLEGKSRTAEQSLRSKADAFQKEVERYQQSAQTMTQQQRAATEQRLQQQQQQLQAQNQNASTELATEESEEMKKIYDRVEAYLQELSKDKGYKMVLTYSRGNSAILYGDSTLDVTTDVLKALNDRYKSAADSTAAAATTKK